MIVLDRQAARRAGRVHAHKPVLRLALETKAGGEAKFLKKLSLQGPARSCTFTRPAPVEMKIGQQTH
jgi:hypothetical protein